MNHEKFYSKALFYDIAFRFKDVNNENKTLIEIFQEINGVNPLSFLDIAAGPAINAIEMSKSGLKSFAIDQSKEMVEYGQKKATEANQKITYLKNDMRDFTLPESVDLAALFMASTGYLLTNEDMIQHLRAVASNLNSKGIYILEMIHPRDIFSIGVSTSTEWEETEGDIKVSIQWGDKNDYFDPITQTKNVTVCLKYETANDSGEITDQCAQREYTFQEMKALIELSGVFKLKKSLGSWDKSIPFSNEKEAWRMILILQKIDV